MMIQKAKVYLREHRNELLLVFFVFLLAFGIRGQLMKYDLIFEFDSYFHARMAGYVLAHNFTIPPHDPNAYYELPEGGSYIPSPGDGPSLWVFTVALFKVFTLWGPYNKALWFAAVKFYPAIFGALTCVVMYYFGKEMYGKFGGAAMAFFAAVVPSYVYRTMAGFFKPNLIGPFWMALGLLFMARALKKAELNRDTVINSLLSAFFFSVMGWMWQGSLMVYYLLAGFVAMTLLIMVLRKIFLSDYSEKPAINVVANTLIIFLVVGALTWSLGWENGFSENIGKIFVHQSGGGTGLNLLGAGQTSSSVYSISVGEESLGAPYWGNKYNALAVFVGWPVPNGFPWYIPGFVFIFLIYRIIMKKDDYLTPLAFTFIVLGIYLAYIKLKFHYYNGLPVAVAAGLTVADLYMFAGERPGFEKQVMAFVLGFFLLVGVAAGSYFVSQNIPTIEQDTGWKEALQWIDANANGAKFFNWWDEGHWISYFGGRVSTDNRNVDFNANSDYAQFILAADENTAVEILRTRYNPDYVIVGRDLIDKLPSLGIYAYKTTNQNDPRVAQYFSGSIPCGKTTDQLSGVSVIRCGGNQIPEDQFNALPTHWTDQPNQVSQGQRVFIYRKEDGSELYLLNKAANDTFIAKMLFARDTLQHFDLIYSYKEVNIYKFKNQ